MTRLTARLYPTRNGGSSDPERDPAGTRTAHVRAPLTRGDGPGVPELLRKLRRERSLGRCGHGGYDLSRHLAITKMLKEARAKAAYEDRAASQRP